MDPLDMPGLHVFYDAAGALVGNMTGKLRDAQVTAQANGHQHLAVDEMPDAQIHYVSNGLVVAKALFAGRIDKTSIKAGGQDAATLSGLPTPCTVAIGRTRYQVVDGSAEITLNLPGSYTVVIESATHLLGTFALEAT